MMLRVWKDLGWILLSFIKHMAGVLTVKKCLFSVFRAWVCVMHEWRIRDVHYGLLRSRPRPVRITEPSPQNHQMKEPRVHTHIWRVFGPCVSCRWSERGFGNECHWVRSQNITASLLLQQFGHESSKWETTNGWSSVEHEYILNSILYLCTSQWTDIFCDSFRDR